MAFKLKKLKSVLKTNQFISDFFLKFLTIKDLRNDSDDSVIVINEPEIIEIDLSNYSIDSSPYWKNFKTFKQDAVFYSEHPNASIVSKGIVVNKSNEVILENCIFQLEYLNELYSNHFV